MGELRTDAFAFPMPSGWVDRTVITITGPGDDSYAPNIVVTREQLCDNLGTGGYAMGWLRRLADEVPVTEARPVEHVELDGRKAQLHVVSWAAVGLRLRQIAALFVVGDEGWAIVGTATEWQFDELEVRFRELLAGFQVVDPVVST